MCERAARIRGQPAIALISVIWGDLQQQQNCHAGSVLVPDVETSDGTCPYDAFFSVLLTSDDSLAEVARSRRRSSVRSRRYR